MDNRPPKSLSHIYHDIYSGRPNPEWEVTPQFMTQLEQTIAAVAASQPIANVLPPTGLGKRGYLVVSDNVVARVHDDKLWMNNQCWDDSEKKLLTLIESVTHASR